MMSSWNLDWIPGRHVMGYDGNVVGFGVTIVAIEVGGFVGGGFGVAIVGFIVDCRIEKNR